MSSSGMPVCVCKITKQSQTYQTKPNSRAHRRRPAPHSLISRRALPQRRPPERPNLAHAWVAYGTVPFALYVLL
jgi:hypothetical protein